MHVPLSAKKRMHLAKRLRRENREQLLVRVKMKILLLLLVQAPHMTPRHFPNDIPAQITDASVPEPPVVDQVRDYFTTKS